MWRARRIHATAAGGLHLAAQAADCSSRRVSRFSDGSPEGLGPPEPVMMA